MSSTEIDKLIDSVLQEKEYEIRTKTESFSMIKLSDYKQTFIELVFVILAAGTSAKLDAGGTGMNGIAYRVYGCGIFNGPQQIIVSLESVIVLPKWLSLIL